MARIFLIDGTYELFRNYFALPSRRTDGGTEVGAVVGLIRSLLALLREERVDHLAVAFDSVIESFRNELFEGYKTGEGVDQLLLEQFSLAEQATRALGLVTWSMVEFEADDALATAARRWEAGEGVDQILICSPDKDLSQCVRGEKVVCYDRMRDRVMDERAVLERYGIGPESVPDWLALVGDKADGIPGIPRWGEKTASRVLAAYAHLEKIPRDPAAWTVALRGREALARILFEQWDAALLYRDLATLRSDVPLEEDLEELAWKGVDRERFSAFCRKIEQPGLAEGR